MKQTSTLRSTVPSRLEASKLVVASFAFSVGSYFAFPPLVGLGAVVLFGSLAVLFLCGICFPGRFLQGVVAVSGGFEVWRPLRKPLLVSYCEVDSIVAVARGGGEDNDDLTFRVRTRTTEVVVHGFDFYASGAFAHMAQAHGFNQAAFESASSHVASLRDSLIGKQFSLYVRGGQPHA